MDLVRELFRYHAWATAQLLDHCAGLPAARLAERPGGTARSVIGTFAHMLAVEGWALRVLSGDNVALAAGPSSAAGSGDAKLPGLASLVERQAAKWDAVLARLDRSDVTLPARDGRPAIKHAETMLVMEVLHNGELHRAEITLALAALGLPGMSEEAADVQSYWLARQEFRPHWPRTATPH